MITREEIVAEGRRWIGTPYHHQASTIGIGSDCLGLIRGIWRNLLGQEPEIVPAYTMDWGEINGSESLLKGARRWMNSKQINLSDLGDVILFRMRANGVAKHLGLISATGSTPKFIHAYSGHGVVESSFSTPWARKVVEQFEFSRRPL
jgi:NlpC/P60 family putative phage cell wall peptidase